MPPTSDRLPLFFPRSTDSTLVNKTGAWRYFQPLYQEKTAPCSAACPLGEDIATIEMLTARGMFAEARQVILLENPFPSICGRVCFHPCERACNRGKFDEPVAIRHLERFLGDGAQPLQQSTIAGQSPVRGKSVAIVGAGPAGLAAAYFLARLGYGCEVFEAQAEPGGLLRWGIPGYRLPTQPLIREIRRIEELGVAIHCGRPIAASELREFHVRFDAVFIGCGSGRPVRLDIEGGHLAAEGLELLRSARAGQVDPPAGLVAVIGGGNTAVDVARTLLRLGAEPVIVYRRRRQDMPAFEPEVRMALEEGVGLEELLAPVRIEADSTSAETSYVLTLQPMRVGEILADGRARVLPDDKPLRRLQVKHIVGAIGAAAEPAWMPDPDQDTRQMTLSHCIIHLKQQPVVFGGDLTNRIQSVTDAIASGKQAAVALDILFRKGWDAVEGDLATCRVGPGPAISFEVFQGLACMARSSHVVSFPEINTDYFRPARRVALALRSAEQREHGFDETEPALAGDSAVAEAGRCFNCGICNACDVCRLFCPDMAVVGDDRSRRIDLDYCKGCGICVTECPRNAMAMKEETP
jgi:NADPH-dependent glutamate synthase beta subunit-like oxidoreductase/ferredoxin